MSRFTDHAVALCRRAPNAKSVRVGSVTVTGPVTEEDRITTDASGAEALRRVTIAVVPSSAFTTEPARHSTVTVGTESYTLRDVHRLDDGELFELVLARTAL